MSGLSMIETKLTVARTATVISSAPLNVPAETVWILLHGYAQLATEFMALFEEVARPNVLFVAPEGLSRLYRRPRDTEIGASWMTAVARQDEINDYIAYLNQVYDLIIDEQGRRPPTFGVLGFSQGAATASRWVAAGMKRPDRAIVPETKIMDRMVLWGGAPAAELRSASYQKKIAPCQTDWVTGTVDRYTPPEKLTDLLPSMDSDENPIRITVFEGKHELQSDVLRKILFG